MDIPYGFGILFVFVSAAIHALLEIEIEGKHGWAENLPTQRFKNKLIARVSETGYITGFHILSSLLLLVLLHFPILIVRDWSWSQELFVLGFFMFHVTVEDFLWFVFNPHYGVHHFRKGKIWWHKSWLLGLPTGYWFGLPLAAALWFVSSKL